MAAVNLKLSSRDAGYLVSLLDAVSAATKDLTGNQCRVCRENEVVPDPQCIECRGTGIQRDSEMVKRAYALRNASPFGDFKSTHAFALRMGATLLTAKNIADSHNE